MVAVENVNAVPVSPEIVVGVPLKSAFAEDCHTYVYPEPEPPLAKPDEAIVDGVAPTHTSSLPLMVPANNGCTLTVTVAVFTQPLASVPVTVKVVCALTVATTELPVVADKPAEGDQL